MFSFIFTKMAQALFNELDNRFSNVELLDVFGIIYPQYWTQEGGDDTFQQHLLVLKNFYCTSKTETFDRKQLLILEMLSASKLDVEQSLFKLTMKANSEAACAPLFK